MSRVLESTRATGHEELLHLGARAKARGFLFFSALL